MAARLFGLRRLLLQSDRAVPSSAAFPPPPPYAVLGRPRLLSAQAQAAAGSDLPHDGGDENFSAWLKGVGSFLLASLAVWTHGEVTAWKRGEQGSARLQRIKDYIHEMDVEIQRLEEAKKKSIRKLPVEDHQLQAGSYTVAQIMKFF